MSTPHDPQGTPGHGAGRPATYGQSPPGQSPPGQSPPGQQPRYGQPGPYDPRAGQYGQPPGPYGQPYPAPYGGNQGQPVYSPYGTPYQAGLDRGAAAPVRRPPIMGLALGLLILSTLPFLAIGVILLLVPITAESIPAGLLEDPRLVQAGATLDLLVSVLRVGGGILLVLALLYILFSVLAYQGRNWARIILTILTVIFVLALGVGLLQGAGSDLSSLLVLLGIIAAAVGGVVLLFLPDSARFFSRPRA